MTTFILYDTILSYGIIFCFNLEIHLVNLWCHISAFFHKWFVFDLILYWRCRLHTSRVSLGCYARYPWWERSLSNLCIFFFCTYLVYRSFERRFIDLHVVRQYVCFVFLWKIKLSWCKTLTMSLWHKWELSFLDKTGLMTIFTDVVSVSVPKNFILSL